MPLSGEEMLNYHFKVHHEDDGFWAECRELDGCYTQGDTIEELRESCKEALEVFLYNDNDLSLPEKSITLDRLYSPQ